MRKIEEEMIRAIRARKDWKKDNTEVKVLDDRLRVYLHSNLICTFYFEDKSIVISHCGWKTPTTKSRLNTILKYFKLEGIYQKNYEWYIGDKLWYEQQIQYAANR